MSSRRFAPTAFDAPYVELHSEPYRRYIVVCAGRQLGEPFVSRSRAEAMAEWLSTAWEDLAAAVGGGLAESSLELQDNPGQPTSAPALRADRRMA